MKTAASASAIAFVVEAVFAVATEHCRFLRFAPTWTFLYLLFSSRLSSSLALSRLAASQTLTHGTHTRESTCDGSALCGKSRGPSG